MEELVEAILRDLCHCRQQLAEANDIYNFDQAWGIESTTPDGAVVLNVISRDALRREFIFARIWRSKCLSSNEENAAIDVWSRANETVLP
jgi:hypothetical protein